MEERIGVLKLFRACMEMHQLPYEAPPPWRVLRHHIPDVSIKQGESVRATLRDGVDCIEGELRLQNGDFVFVPDDPNPFIASVAS